MKTVIRFGWLLCVIALAAIQARAQAPQFSATTGDVVLSAAATKFTIQQPATNAKQVLLAAAVVYCSAACDMTQAQNGAAATATAGTVNQTLPFSVSSLATVWTASNVGSGTPTGGIYHMTAGQYVTLSLTGLSMGNTGTATNYTIAISTITGTANITLFWSEK